MGPKSAAAATASTPAKSVNPEAPAEPSLADLTQLLGGRTSAQPAKTKAAKPAAAADPDHDPEFDDEETAAEAETDESEDSSSEASAKEEFDPAAPAAEDPANPEADPAAPADEDPEAEPAPAGLDDEDKATRKKLSPDQQKSFDKAVQKRARENKELKAQLAERDQALATLAAAPAVAATPTAENPLADVEDEASLATRLANSRALWRWARLHPNGGTLPDASGKEIEITADRALEIQVQEEELQNFHAPAREKFLKTRSEQEAAAVQAHPWLKNKTSQGAVEIEATLRRNPGLRSVPGIKLLLADSLAGRAARLTKAKAVTPAAKAAAAIPVAPATPAGRNPPPRVAGAVKTASTALKTVHETGRDPGNAALGALISRRR